MTNYQAPLRSLGLEEFIEVFHANDIDDESLLLLSDNELKELIPKIGPRIKIKHLINSLKTQQDITITAESPDRTLTAVSPDRLLTADTPISINNFFESASETDCASVASAGLKFATQGNIVEKILIENLDGRALIKEGQSDGGLLKEGSRRKLSQFVINNYIENKPPNFKISTEEFYRLASDIVSLFPRESIVVYYSAYLSGKDGAAKKNASGKLYETYITRRRKLRQSGELAETRRQSSRSSRSTSVTNDTASESSDNNQIDDYDDNLSFLRNNVEPWRKVVECWTATSTHRLKILYDGQQGGILLKYPALKQPEGYTLLMNDFNQLFPGKENSLFSSIENHKENIVNYAKRKADYSRDRNLKTKIHSLIALIAKEEPESIKNVCLVLLTYIINTSPARKRKGRDIVKFSRSEITSAFTHQIASEAEVTPSIIERREVLAKQQRSMQPYVIYIGEDCTKIRASYVVIDDTIYSFSKLITAVDCAFKVFHSTGACYPEECEDVWLFIQLGFFNIHTKFDRNTQVVNSLMTDLGLICDKK